MFALSRACSRSFSSLKRSGAYLLLATIIAAGSSNAAAQTPLVMMSKDGATAILSNPDAQLEADLRNDSTRVTIRAAGAEAGMTSAITFDADAYVLTPRFPFLPGADYEVVIEGSVGGRVILPVSAISQASSQAAVESVWPTANVIPENTLRLYVVFDRPMARGSARENLRLEDADGVRLDDSFLNLATELWSPDQTRLTLLLDPGRIKRGVGPNTVLGAPLEDGRAYRLVVGGNILDASGQPLGEDFVHVFRTGAPERTEIDPALWSVDAPMVGSHDALVVSFQRLMDRANAVRTIHPIDDQSRPIQGTATTTDRVWTFVPDDGWPQGSIRLRVDPLLEDVAGNTICSAFDVEAGAGRVCDMPMFVSID